jgi:hypothetical protein
MDRVSGGIYRYYVLGLLILIYAFNFLDRQIITILAPSLKADLGLTDAQLGLLFGTAFALFYALFGIPLAKLADGWNRVKTISLGLSFWSGMTALSGFASNFVQLGAARVGVGIGEASASPAAYSLLQDYFPREKRATALAFYSSGIYVGVGASLIFGGAVIAYWDTHYTEATRPFGLAGWQATFLAFGIPGLLLALLLFLTVREPTRGAIDGLTSPSVRSDVPALLHARACTGSAEPPAADPEPPGLRRTGDRGRAGDRLDRQLPSSRTALPARFVRWNHDHHERHTMGGDRHRRLLQLQLVPVDPPQGPAYGSADRQPHLRDAFDRRRLDVLRQLRPLALPLSLCG